MQFLKTSALTILFVVVAAANFAVGQEPVRSGKAPIIIIPGLTGSDLYNSRTGEQVWFKPVRSKDDDIRLPISPDLARNRDNLVTRDIMREVKIIKILPEIEIYEKLIGALETKGGYTEGKWDAPKRGGDKDTFYVFPYDWRRDNVESARLLVRQIESLKRKLRKPNLKFNIVAHSMGGLIARYAAMYGNADIPSGKITPTWAGGRHFDKIFLLGTPNAGSVDSVNALLNGFSYVGGGLNLPFVQNISRFDVFTIPSIYQLLPHEGTLKVYDDKLQPMSVDIYDPATWETYNWGIWKEEGYEKKFEPNEIGNIRPYFNAVLERAKRFQMALNAPSARKTQVAFYLVGGDCKETQNAFVLRRNEKKDLWITMFKPDSFTNSAGEKITAEQLKPLLYDVGDSVVPKRSLTAEGVTANGNGQVLPIAAEIFQCEGHTKLVTSTEVQDKLLMMLNAVPIP